MESEYLRLLNLYEEEKQNYDYLVDRMLSPGGVSRFLLGFERHLELTEDTVRIFKLSSKQVGLIDDVIAEYEESVADWELENLRVLEKSKCSLKVEIPETRNTKKLL